MLEIRNIAFTYRSRPVLRDVSFVVSPGETVSLVGDNGEDGQGKQGEGEKAKRGIHSGGSFWEMGG